MGNDFIRIMWEQAEIWRIILAFISGIIVSCIYFGSLHWSLKHLSEFKHKYRMFATIALLRISLFFAVLVLISQRNVVIILFYLLAFFITRVIIIWRVKVADDEVEHSEKEGTDGLGR